MKPESKPPSVGHVVNVWSHCVTECCALPTHCHISVSPAVMFVSQTPKENEESQKKLSPTATVGVACQLASRPECQKATQPNATARNMMNTRTIRGMSPPPSATGTDTTAGRRGFHHRKLKSREAARPRLPLEYPSDSPEGPEG